MKGFKVVLRGLVALVFIGSGLVKAVDPVGFSFKLEEYFSPTVFDSPFLERYALPLAVAVSVAEVLAGLLLLLTLQVRRVLLFLIALCLFFAFLTFYSAYYNVVTDCGCFGDALKLTPWQSFWKDVVLLAGLLVLWRSFRESARGRGFGWRIGFFILGVTVLAWVVYRGIWHEPLVDFRDYKVGVDLNSEKRKMVENPNQYATFYLLKNQKTGEEREVNQDEYVLERMFWAEGSPWQIQKDRTATRLVRQGYSSEISKFRLEDALGNDRTQEILKADRVVLLFSYRPSAMASESLEAVGRIVSQYLLVYGVSTETGAFPSVETFLMDATAIKTIARSNPFVLVLAKGVIVEKKSLSDFVK